MANVSMDLAELKALEQQIADLKAEKQELIDKQKMVIVHHKYFNGKLKPSSKHGSPYIRIEGVEGSSRYNPSGRFDQMFSLKDALDRGFVEIDLTEDSSRNTKDYCNLSEIQRDIRNEIKGEYVSEISLLKADIRAFNDQIERAKDYEEARLKELESQQKSELNLLNEGHKKDLDRISQAYKTKLKTINHSLVVARGNFDVLSKEFETFKEDRKTKTLVEQIEELKIQLATEQKKTFWQKLFNK